MPKHPGVTSGENDKEINDEQNIPWLLLKDGVGLTYRFRAAVTRNTKNSFREDPREGGRAASAESKTSSLCILP